MLKDLKVPSSLTRKYAFHRSAQNAKGGPHGTEF